MLKKIKVHTQENNNLDYEYEFWYLSPLGQNIILVKLVVNQIQSSFYAHQNWSLRLSLGLFTLVKQIFAEHPHPVSFDQVELHPFPPVARSILIPSEEV